MTLKLDEIVRKRFKATYEPILGNFQLHGFDFQLSLTVHNGEYTRDFFPEESEQIELIMNDFVSNARKAVYGSNCLPYQLPEEMRTIPCRIAIELEEDTQRYVISVADNGRGIPPENRTQIFERGFSTFGTSGIGLFLAKGRAETLKATIDFQSEVGKGSTFRLYLPK